MSDIVDDANESAEEFLKKSLDLFERNKKKPHVFVDYECSECGIALNEFRARNYGICVDCQRDIEKHDKLRKMRGSE